MMSLYCARLLALALTVALLAVGNCLLAQHPSRDEVIDVPCEFVDNVVYLPVTVNGHGGFFMSLDTGTNPSAIDAAQAKMLGLPLATAAGAAKGFGTNTVKTQRTTVDRLNASGIEATQVEFEALDLSAKTATAAKPIIGLLGYSFLRDRIIEIDYLHKRLRVYAQAPSPPAGAIVLPLELDHGVPVINVELARKKSRALIDTGGSYKLLVTPSEAKKLGLGKQLTAAKPIGGSGYSGEQQVRLGTLSRLTVGRFAVDKIETVFVNFGKESPFKVAGASLGSFYLQDFVLALDYRAKTLMLHK